MALTCYRDLFYQNVQLFKNKQYVCDQVIDDIAVSLGVERSQLNLVASSKGLVVGPITFTLTSGALVDCSNHVCLIPNESNIASIQVNATHLLVIEKDATFEALLQHNFLQVHCLMNYRLQHFAADTSSCYSCYR